jgi:hypothetical protein
MASEKVAPHIGVAGGAGLGKSDRALEGLAQRRMSGKCVNYYVTEQKLSDELAARFAAKAQGRVRALVIRGRGQQLADGSPMCRKADLAEEVAGVGQNVYTTLCFKVGEDGAPDEKCEHYDSCPYIRQLQDQGPAVRFMPHAYLFIEETGLPEADINVIDERFWPSSLRESRIVLQRLAATRRHISGRSNPFFAGKIADLTALSRKAITVFEGGDHSPATFRAAGITASGCAFAKGMAYDLADKLQVSPGMNAAEQRRRIDAFKANEARQAGRFWSLLEQEVDLDRPRLRSISYRPDMPTPDGGLEDRIEMRWSADLKISTGPTLLIDADLDLEIARRFLPDLEMVTIRAKRQSYSATQITDRPVSKQMMMYDLMGLSSAEECQRAANRRGDLRALLEIEAARSAAEAGDGSGVLCVSYKLAVEAIASDGVIPGVEYGHFNAIRGKDRWKQVDVLVVAGRPQPSVEEIERLTDALFYKGDRQIAYIAPDAEGRKSWPIEYRGFRGVAGAAPVEYHPDPLCAAVLTQIREAELIQAIDRARLVHRASDRPCKILVLTNVVLPLTVHQLSTWDGVIPDRFARAVWRGPAVPASYGELARVFPDLWQSAGAVEQDYRRSTPYESLIDLLIGKRRGLKRVEYRLPQQRGPWTPALVAAAADPHVALESVVGPVAALRLVAADPKPERICKMHDVRSASGRTSSPVCATLVVCDPAPRGRLFAIDLPFDLPRQSTAPVRGAQLHVVPTVTQPSPRYEDMFGDDLSPWIEGDRIEATRRWLAECARRHAKGLGTLEDDDGDPQSDIA